jgi:hypothetical protein
MEYGLTWSRKATPSGLRIWRLRASARRTSGNGCSGWPTPDVPCGGQGLPTEIEWKDGTAYTNGRKVQVKLAHVAEMAGWPTPMAGSPETDTYNAAGNTDSSRKTVELVAGWATPAARGHKSESATDEFNAERAAHPRGKPLSYEVTLADWQTPKANEKVRSDEFLVGREPNAEEALAFGPGTISSRAGTAKAGVLNPDFTRWLMGYPAAWGCCGATAMQSARKPGRRSSGRSSTRKAG